ncbi:MAG: hypothetical protein H6963_03440 [Chromatiaceae bacterium]|nr:hypothetical protein [Chromatiaceae bacterium]
MFFAYRKIIFSTLSLIFFSVLIVAPLSVRAGSWTIEAPLPEALGHIASSEVEGKIYTFGGWGGGSTRSDAVYEFDPDLGSWVSKAPMPTPRATALACQVNGKIYVIGREVPIPGTTIFQRLDVVEQYDPDTDTWSTMTPITEQGQGAW